MTTDQLNESLADAETGNVSAASALVDALQRMERDLSRDIAPADWRDVRKLIDRCRASSVVVVKFAADAVLRAEYARRARAERLR